MAAITGPLADLAARQHGILTTSDFARHDVSLHARRHLVSIGAVVAVHRGVYRVATSLDTFRSRCAAVSLGTGAIVTGTAAGHLWGFRHVDRPDLPIVLLPHGSNAVARGAIVRRSGVIEQEDQVTFDDGIVRASPPRAWFDCARDVDDTRFETVTEWVLDRHATVPTLWRTVRRLATRGRDGSARVRRVMSARSDWQRPAGSKLELRVLRGLEARGVPELVRQHPIRLANGIVVHPDGADPIVRWAVEVDHVTWHGGRFDAQRDKQRDRWLRKVGWIVERVTDQELRDDADRALDDLAEMYHLHCSSAA